MAEEEKDTYQKIKDKREEMKPVFERMDEDEKLYFLEPYTMRHLYPDASKRVEDVANVTLNDPLLYATKAIAALGSMAMQPVVKMAKKNDKKSTKIEEFLDDMDYVIDEFLVNRLMLGLDAFINEQIFIRGRTGARCCLRIGDDGMLVPDVLPVDTRYFPIESNEKGIVWGAPTFTRNKERILADYPEAKGLRNTGNEVIDWWSGDKNKVIINGKYVALEEDNSYGRPPLVYVICPIGSMFGSEGAVKHRGESIFWPNRDLWPEMNRTASIWQTMNYLSMFGALQYESDHGENMPKPKKSPYKPKTVHGVQKGGGYRQIPLSDIKMAARYFHAMLETRLQRGSLSSVDYGSLAFPLSAIAITRLTSSREDIFLPRVQAKALFKQALSRMIIEQCIGLGVEISIGRPGNMNAYSVSDLEGDYTIMYQFATDSAEQKIANLSIANASRGLIPDNDIRRDILKLPDPDGAKVQLESDQAEQIDEVLLLYRRGRSLLITKEGRPPIQNIIQAQILRNRIWTILEQRETLGKLSPIERKEPAAREPGKGILPLMTEGGGGGPTREPADETPEEGKEAGKEAANA